jgi:hypothetical protein
MHGAQGLMDPIQVYGFHGSNVPEARETGQAGE